MSLGLFLLLVLKIGFAHPFDSRVVGHQMVVELRRDSLSLTYQLELPIAIAQEDMRLIAEENPQMTDTEALTQILLKFKKDEIQSSIQLRLNDVVRTWSTVELKQKKLLKETQFALFRVTLKEPLTDDIRQITIINQIHMEEKAIFNHQLLVGPGVRLVDTDLLPMQDNGKRHIFHGSWQSEPKLRELRVGFLTRDDSYAFFEQQWRKINGWPPLRTAPNALIVDKFNKRWEQGVFELWEALLLIVGMAGVMSLVGSYKRNNISLLAALGIGFVLVGATQASPQGWLELGLAIVLLCTWPWTQDFMVERFFLLLIVLVCSSGSPAAWIGCLMSVLLMLLQRQKERTDVVHRFLIGMTVLLAVGGLFWLFLY